MSEMLDAALDYASRGWGVIPLHAAPDGVCTCGRKCLSPGKHPRTRHGLMDATIHESVIRGWWQDWPDANIGIVTGSRSGLFVLDVDTKRSVELAGGVIAAEGRVALRDLAEMYGALPSTLVAETGSGGEHYYFTYPTEGEWGNRTQFAPSLDIRADGGYVVAPPSVHASGHTYRWINEDDPAPTPSWLLTVLTSRETERNRPVDMSEPIPEGMRNDTIFRLGCRYKGDRDYSETEMFGLLMAANLERCDPPLDGDEVRRIAQSVVEKYQTNEPPPIWEVPADAVPFIAEGDDLATPIWDFLAHEPERPVQIVEGLIAAGTGTIVAGPPGVGKTWAVLDLALSVATGNPFLGHFKTEQSGVLFIDEEGHRYGMWHRLSQMTNAKGLGFMQDQPLYLSIGKELRLDDEVGITKVRRMIERYKPKLIILDSLTRFHAGNENDSREMANFFAIAKRLMRTYGCAFLFVHHIRKPSAIDSGDVMDLLRGSSEIRAFMDTGIVIRRGGDSTELRFDHGKSRWARELDPFLARLMVQDEWSEASVHYLGPVDGERVEDTDIWGGVQRVFVAVQNRGMASSQQVASITGLSEETVKRHLKRLVASGKLLKETSSDGKQCVWLPKGDASGTVPMSQTSFAPTHAFDAGTTGLPRPSTTATRD